MVGNNDTTLRSESLNNALIKKRFSLNCFTKIRYDKTERVLRKEKEKGREVITIISF